MRLLQWVNFRTFWGSSNSSSNSNTLISYAAATVLKVYTFPALGNITRYIWGHCCQKQVSRACISNYSPQNTVKCDCLLMLYFFICNWMSLQQLAWRWVLWEQAFGFWKTFPNNIHPSGPDDELCLWRNTFLLVQFYYLQRQWIMVMKLSFSTHPKGCSIEFKKS